LEEVLTSVPIQEFNLVNVIPNNRSLAKIYLSLNGEKRRHQSLSFNLNIKPDFMKLTYGLSAIFGLLFFCNTACKKTNSSPSNPSPNPNPQNGCLLIGVTYNNHQVIDSGSWTLDYNNNNQLVQAYFNPGSIVTHINYKPDGKISTITSSYVPYTDTIIYSGDNISALVVLAADGTPMDTTIFSENADGWITDVRLNLRINRLAQSLYGHITYNYENGELQSIYQSIENLQPSHPTSVYLPNNLPVQDPKNPFYSSSKEMLFLFYEIFNVDALGSGWTAGNIESLNFTNPAKIEYEQQYDYTLDKNKNVIHRDLLQASDAPGFSHFAVIFTYNYTYECK
jgi:hypothetical protein